MPYARLMIIAMMTTMMMMITFVYKQPVDTALSMARWREYELPLCWQAHVECDHAMLCNACSVHLRQERVPIEHKNALFVVGSYATDAIAHGSVCVCVRVLEHR